MGSALNSSKIVNSKIIDSDMTSTNFHSANLTGTKVSEETLKDAMLCKTNMSSGQQDDSGCKP